MQEGLDLEDWPNCAVEGCANKCCLRLNSSKCYPHTMEERSAVIIAQIDGVWPADGTNPRQRDESAT